MKKTLLITLLLPLSIYAQSFMISNIPIPKTYIQNLDPYTCDEVCLQNYLKNDMIFSFLSFAYLKLDNPSLDEIRMMNISILNLGSPIMSDKLRIALLLPYKTIGRYALSTTNATLSYLIAKNRSFELKSYKIDNENFEDINKTLTEIKNDKFNYVIAPLTQKGADVVADINPDINIYFPTINKRDANSTSQNLYYGGIDYRAQSDKLLEESVSPLVIFHDKSAIGNKLSKYEEKKFREMDIYYRHPLDINSSNETTNIEDNQASNISDLFSIFDDDNSTLQDDNSNMLMLNEDKVVVKFSIPKRTTNLESHLFENERIKQGSFFINTPIVKSSMIMSQLTLYDSNVTNVLSTQINYDPLLFSMTQYKDRKNMIIANSITEQNNVLTEINSLLGNDIVYDWINYTTTVGVDYFFHLVTNENREYNIEIQNNQMIYPIELLQPSMSRFIKNVSFSKE